MTELQNLFDRYSRDHQNPVNHALHWICIPLIFMSALGLLELVPFLDKVSLASIAITFTIHYYFRLSWRLAAAMFLPLVVLRVCAIKCNREWGADAWKIHLVIFAFALAGQLVGHRIEGRKPSFFEDLRFTLIGPAWLVRGALRKIGIRFI